MIVLPLHEPCGRTGMGEQLPLTLDVHCTVAREWRARRDGTHGHVDKPGCGGVSRVSPHSGVRLPPERV